MYKGIVLNKIQTNAFLTIAAEENLICEKGMTDGVFDSLTHQEVSRELEKKLLEQFAVAGTVYVAPFIYRCLDGELIDKGIIKPYAECNNDFPGLLNYDVDTIQDMMAEKGYDIKRYTTDKIHEIFGEWKEKAQEFYGLEKTYKVDYTEVSIQRTIGLEPKNGYNGIDVEHFIELGDYVYHNPIFVVLQEYKTLFDIAYTNDLLSPVVNATTISASSNFESVFPVMEGAKAVRILNYTSNRLHTVYTAATLRDNVNLVQTEEAKAYRNKVDEWMMAFSGQNYDNMRLIEKDIEKAQKAMKHKGYAEAAGKICATIGFFATLASLLDPTWIPVAGAAMPVTEIAKVSELAVPSVAKAYELVVSGAGKISEIATYLGFPLSLYNPTKRYLWASFGMRY